MYKSCNVCGKMHRVDEKCPLKKIDKKASEENEFRSSYSWKKKREQIKQRDRHLCQYCLKNSNMTRDKFNMTDLSVHHIVPLAVDFEKRLDDDNLITLCSKHHEDAEKGIIKREELIEIVNKTVD